MLQRLNTLALASYALGTFASAYRVAIHDTDSLREVCSGMWGGKEASIELSFNPASAGQVALVIYEWKDVQYLGAETPRSEDEDESPRTYICTTSAVRSGLCSSSQLGSFITTLPEDKTLDSTSIYTRALKFSTEDNSDANEEYNDDAPPVDDTPEFEDPYANGADAVQVDDEGVAGIADGAFRKRGLGDWFGGMFGSAPQDEVAEDLNPDDAEDQYESAAGEQNQDDGENQVEDEEQNDDQNGQDDIEDQNDGETQDQLQEDDAEPLELRPDDDGEDQDGGLDREPANEETADEEPVNDELSEEEPVNDEPTSEEPTDEKSAQDEPTQTQPPKYEDDTMDIPEAESGTGAVAETYLGPITYSVPKTGYYCIGIVPVTLVESGSTNDKRQSATHAEYSGMVTFHNVFEGELPAVEYPKIGFYFLLSIVYAALGLGWAFLCFKHRDELLPMQYYISGTIIFLIIEMLANFAYYRYINKHGGGATSLAFLFVVSVLNAARNSLSFFLLLIVSMGLSVVRQSLGSVMTKVRILTALHFIFGVLYSVGTVQVELDSAALVMVMLLIFPLALTLTAFLMWIIVSLNGTIMFLQAHKQRMKLQMFQRLWRILILAVIAIAAFFVVSSMSLSNRLDENYAPNNWRYRWILLDGSLALIYLAVFSGVAWIWRPTANNRSFSMSQELAQDEAEADAEDYEIDDLAHRANGHQPLGQEEDDDESKPFGRKSGPRGDVGEENTVFALDDSDEEGSEDGKKARGKGGYRDEEEDEERGAGAYKDDGRVRLRRDS